MANTAPKIAEKERRESPDLVDKKAQLLVEQIKKSKHFMVFTGAGISTSAGRLALFATGIANGRLQSLGIPDFRGPEGVWTLKRQGRLQDLKMVNTLQAIPTPAHMALVELQNRGILIYLDRISELHGNSNREYCKQCGKEYIRDFRAVANYEKTVHDHRTGRKCARCDGDLYGTIINFTESLPAESVRRAHFHAKKADLCLVLGSSLTVTPANEIPEIVGERRNSKLAICNFQSTPIDHLTNLRIYTSADELMTRVMKKLDIPIPTFILHRRLVVKLETTADKRHQLTLLGVDVDDTPVTFLKSVKLENNRRVAHSEPFVITFRGSLESGTLLRLDLEFMGHYGEPNLQIVHECTGESDSETLYLLEYHPHKGDWETQKPERWDMGEGAHTDMETAEDSSLLLAGSNSVPAGIKPTSAVEIIPRTIIEID
ncbi:MAG: hypothetical protein Q9220_003892 [cf. Caloplaca sp. 1 TL-2023]